MKSFFTQIPLLLIAFLPSYLFAQKEFVTEDKVYEKNIKTVLLYPYEESNPIGSQLSPPIIPLSQTTPLVLEFDELTTAYKNYYAKIIYCNADWSVSSLSSVQYMRDFNEFFINNRQGSVSTRFAYIHYVFPLPRVNYSGNYIIKVYKDYNEDDLILTRRFSVYESQINISPKVTFSADPSVRNTHEQVDFNINYPNTDIVNPIQTLRVILRQNYRWNKTITDLKPSVINENIRSLEYFYFNRENNFEGGNEYRRIDIESAMYSGFNIMKVRRDSSKAEAFVYPEKTRAKEAYSQPLMPDNDGRFYIMNKETGDNQIMADYTYVTFTFESAEPAPGKVYVMGGLTDYKLDKNFEMTYNSETKKYTCQVLLKQGVYDYIYVLADPKTGKMNENYFEGSHSVTENSYDILVYYRPFGSRNDFLLGYQTINYLPRR